MKVKYLPYIAIAMLILLLILQRECNRPKPCPEISKPDTITLVHDSIITIHDVIYKPKYVTIHDSIPVNLPFNADTLAVLHDYFSVVDYTQQIVNDSTANLNAKIRLYMNRINRFEVTGHIKQKHTTEIITKYIHEKPKLKVYAGIGAGAMLPDKFLLGGSIAVNTKQDHLYTVIYDPFHKAGMINIYWKIRLKKK